MNLKEKISEILLDAKQDDMQPEKQMMDFMTG